MKTIILSIVILTAIICQDKYPYIKTDVKIEGEDTTYTITYCITENDSTVKQADSYDKMIKIKDKLEIDIVKRRSSL